MISHGCVTAAAHCVVSTWSWDHVLDASIGFTMKALTAVALGLNWSESEVVQSCLTLCNPGTVAHQTPPSIGFSRQEHLSGLPFPSPGDLPDPGIEPRSPTLQADALTSEPLGKPQTGVTSRLCYMRLCYCCCCC